MHHDLSDSFNVLREEFRLLQSGFRIQSTMAESPLNNIWFTAALLNGSNTEIGSDPSMLSISSHLTPFKTCDSSLSSVESERAQSELPTTTVVSGAADGVPTPYPQTRPHISEDGEKISHGSVQSRSRKGHKKSRGGCFNCKRRKIKARVTMNF